MNETTGKQIPLTNEHLYLFGITDYMNKFMIVNQLYDRNLWKIFVDQFRERKDAEKGSWLGEFFGKMMRGACLTYKYVRDSKLFAILSDAIEDFLSTQDELGRFSTYVVEKEFTGWDMWGRKYAMLGLEYFYDITEDQGQKRRILTALRKHADYIVANVGKGKKHPVAYAESFWHHAGLPSCSILEPFVKLYKLTGDENYLKYAEEIIETGFTNNEDNLVEIFFHKEKKPAELISKKAYEMMSCFQGLIEYYEVKKEEKYLIAVRNFVDSIIENELTAIGAIGTEHEFFDDSKQNQTNHKSRPMLETCVTVTFMNLCYKMLQITGECRFADYIENAAYNAMFGAVNTEKNKKTFKWDDGPNLIETHYFIPIDSYSPLVQQRRAIDMGGCLSLREDGMKYGCCTCISSAGTAIAALYSVMKTGTAYVINGYEEGQATLLSQNNNEVKIEIKGKPFEEDQTIKIKFSTLTNEKLELKLRDPVWSKNTTVVFKNKKYKSTCGYFYLNEVFENGDIIEIILDTKIYAEKRNGKVLLKKCAVVLARDERYEDGFENHVDIKINEDGSVNGEKVNIGRFKTLAEFLIPTKDGGKFAVCDYSSAGKNWDSGENLRISAWI